MTLTVPRKRSRILVLGLEQRQSKTVVRCMNRKSGEEFGIYKRKNRWCYFSTDQPIKDQTLRRHAQQALDAQ